MYIDLAFEPIGDEAAGIEFFGIKGSGVREYHSIKRQQPGGNWTIGRLTREEGSAGRSILGDLIQKIQAGAEATFGSGTSASELEELVSLARSRVTQLRSSSGESVAVGNSRGASMIASSRSVAMRRPPIPC